MKRFIIRKGDTNAVTIIENLRRFIDELDYGKSWAIEIKEYRKKRSLSQNAYIHAVPLKIICDHTGYRVDDMKEWLCGEFMGWEEYDFMGHKKTRPVKTTSEMNTIEMTDFIEFLQMWGSSELNLYIPSPNEWVE
jgi:hypothetical protein